MEEVPMKGLHKMPLKKMTYERTIQLGSKFIVENGSEYSTNRMGSYYREMIIRNEMMKHDFTKRQLNILIFIANHSFAFLKGEALIPKLQDFELAGIGKTKIKEELTRLEDMHVIKWNREMRTFAISDVDVWKVPYNDGYNEDRAREIFILNVKHAGLDSSKIENDIE
jgi:hypothetical protein